MFGLQKPKIQKLDYQMGAETGIVKPEVRVSDWNPYYTKFRQQFANGYDTMSCVSFSAIASVEAQVNYMIEKDAELKKKLEELGYVKNGKCQLNVWFTAVMSGTRPTGNSFQAVWDSIRKHGVLPDDAGYHPKDFFDVYAWLERENVKQEHIEKAKKFLEVFDVKYQWVMVGKYDEKALKESVKYAPVQIQVKPCDSRWIGMECVPSGCFPFSRHAVLLCDDKKYACQYDTQKDRIEIFDSYSKPHKYTYEKPIYAIVGIVSKKKEKKERKRKIKTKAFTRTLWYGMRNQEVYDLQVILKHEVPHAFSVEPTGYYGWWTRQGVMAFQEKYGLASTWLIRYVIRGRWVGKKTRAKLNSLLTKYTS